MINRVDSYILSQKTHSTLFSDLAVRLATVKIDKSLRDLL